MFRFTYEREFGALLYVPFDTEWSSSFRSFGMKIKLFYTILYTGRRKATRTATEQTATPNLKLNKLNYNA